MPNGKAEGFAELVDQNHGGKAQPFVTHREFTAIMSGVEKLCKSRRETQNEKFKGLTKQIWAATASVGLILSIMQIAIHYGWI